VHVSQELSKADTLLAGRIALARISAAEGKTEDARQHLLDFLTVADTDHERAGYHYWLWKIGSNDEDHYAVALRLYRSLFDENPKNEYRAILDELDRRDEIENAEVNP
jgi:hypothetical protein